MYWGVEYSLSNTLTLLSVTISLRSTLVLVAFMCLFLPQQGIVCFVPLRYTVKAVYKDDPWESGL